MSAGCIFNDLKDLLRGEGLDDEVEGTELHRLDSGLGGPVGGHEYDHGGWTRRTQMLKGLNATDPAQAVVNQDNVRPAALGFLDALLATGGAQDLVALDGEDTIERITNLGFIVDD